MQIDYDLVQRIWDAHHLGYVETLVHSTRGINNPGVLVNDALFLRVDGLTDWDVSRFAGEKRAYDLLKNSGVPVPEVLVLDTSHTLLSHDYMVMTKVSGQPMIDSWPALTDSERHEVAFQAGRYLALMHQMTLERFSAFYDMPDGGFDNWPAFVDDFYQDYRAWGLKNGALDAPLVKRLDTAMQSMIPLLATVTMPRLVHGDYNFENVLQQDGQVTGILDFEWSKAADPAWDFKLHVQWEEDCPGCREPVYAGYQSLRPLDESLFRRATLYRLLMLLDDVVENYADPPDPYAVSRAGMLQALRELEAGWQTK